MLERCESIGSCLRPLESVIRLLSHQYTVSLVLLSGRTDGSLRYSQIREGLAKEAEASISDSTLSRTLSELVDLGILSRKSFDEIPPHVEYSLTDSGRDLFHILEDLGVWSREQCHLGQLKIPSHGHGLGG
ncbi:MAG: helix-turn-helix transcriptional regulator [Candidatus Thorarchaeota archaeon]|nr:helix-turn-helix transcriptional regulator [Candidatus Thorarchaeota archaeon]